MLSPDTLPTSRVSRVFGASVIGPLHVQLNLPCQDACGYEVLPSGSFIIAAADGLGSATMSEVGARMAIESVVSASLAALNSCQEQKPNLEDIVRKAVGIARSVLESHSVAQSCKLRDLACTLILAIVGEDSLSVAHIGDGAVVARLDGRLSLISSPGDSEFTNEVVPLTSSNWREDLRIVTTTSCVESIAVLTDGCQRAAFRKSEQGLEPFERFFNPIFAYARGLTDTTEGVKEIEALLGSQKICENSDDDKTLVVGVVNVG